MTLAFIADFLCRRRNENMNRQAMSLFVEAIKAFGIIWARMETFLAQGISCGNMTQREECKRCARSSCGHVTLRNDCNCCARSFCGYMTQREDCKPCARSTCLATTNVAHGLTPSGLGKVHHDTALAIQVYVLDSNRYNHIHSSSLSL